MSLLSFTAADQHVRRAVSDLADGRPVVVADGCSGHGDLVVAAARATGTAIAFIVRHSSGFVCVAVDDETCNRLELAPMDHGGAGASPYRVSVDGRGTGTGISAAARAATIAALADPAAAPADFVRPGHVIPLLAASGGVLSAPGRAEATVDLARLAGQPPAGALAEIVSSARPDELASGAELRDFAALHDLTIVTIDEIVEHRRGTEPQVRRVTTTALPTVHHAFRAFGYIGVHDAAEHVALVAGDGTVRPGSPVHVHVECLTGDVLRSTLCGCRAALEESLQRFGETGDGIVIYLRPSGPARACGLLQDAAETDRAAGHHIASWILRDLGLPVAAELPVRTSSSAHRIEG